MANPPGSTAPGSATTTRSPTAKLAAPQTIPRPGESSAPGTGLCSGPTSTRHQRITLPFFCGSGVESQHATDHDRPGDVGPGLLHGLDLEPRPDQRLTELAPGSSGGRSA